MSRDLHPVLTKEKSYQPEKWTSLHRYIVLLEVAGKKPGEIAEIVDLSASRVSVILNDYRAELDRIEIGSALADRLTDVHSRLQLYAQEALDVIVDEMREITNKADIRVKTAFGILDRAGFTPVQKQIVAKAEIPSEIADRMEAVAKEVREAKFEYVKVDPKIAEEDEEWDD